MISRSTYSERERTEQKEKLDKRVRTFDESTVNHSTWIIVSFSFLVLLHRLSINSVHTRNRTLVQQTDVQLKHLIFFH